MGYPNREVAKLPLRIVDSLAWRAGLPSQFPQQPSLLLYSVRVRARLGGVAMAAHVALLFAIFELRIHR